MATYTIKSGDTLSQLAKRLNTTVAALKAANEKEITNIHRIYAGQKINLPNIESKTDVDRVFEKARGSFSALTDDEGGFGTIKKTSAVRKPPPAIARTSPVNPRTRAMQSRRKVDPVESVGLMARSQQLAETRPTRPSDPESEPRTMLDRIVGYLDTSTGRAYARSWIDSGVWGKEIFEPEELSLLTQITKENVNRGLTKGSYKHFTEEGGSKMGYGMDTPSFQDAGEALQYILGKHAYVREGDDVLNADEYDFGKIGPNAIKNQSLFKRIKFIKDKFDQFQRGEIKDYGFAHYLAEAFGATPGEGPSVRVNLGNYKDLGIDPERFKNLPTLEQYERENAYRIKQRPLRDLLTAVQRATNSLLFG